MKGISAYVKAQSVPMSQALVRLDGLYGNGAICEDLAGLAYVMRGKDYHLLDLEIVQTRLLAPPDAQTTHPETGTERALFDFPRLQVTSVGAPCRVIVATHPASAKAAPIGTTRDDVVYELFFTALPTQPSRQLMSSNSTCIGGRSRRFSLMRIKNKILTVGVLRPLVGRSSGRSSRSGSGTCAWNWDMLSIPLPCARRSLPQPPSLRNLPHACLSSQLPGMDRPHSRPPGSRTGCPARTLLPNLMARCAVLPTILSTRRNDARSEMGPCGWCMQPALAIAAPVRYVNSVSGTGPPPRNRGASALCCIHSASPPSSTNHRRRVLLPARSSGKTGSVAPIDGSL